MKKVLSSFASNHVFANLVLVTILIAGVIASVNIIRESFPQFSLDMITIQVLYPGADPAEVEEGVTRKIETAIEGEEGIKQYTSKSMEGLSSVTVEVQRGYKVQEVKDRLRTKIDSITSFPKQAEDPVINEIILKDAVMMLALSGNNGEKELKQQAEGIKDRLKESKVISQVELFGSRDYEISVEIPEQTLQRFNLSLARISNAIQNSSLELPGGTIKTELEEIRIRTSEKKRTADDLARIIVKANPDGSKISLGEIAAIKDGFKEETIISLVNDIPTVFIMVYKTGQEDSIKITRETSKFIKKYQNKLPPGMQLSEFYDSTSSLKARINLLSRNGLMGIILVFILLWLFMDLRLAIWCGLGIPISIAGAIFVLWTMGESLNMISLFGFILVLGIVVDDAIVVGESIYNQRINGKPPLQAAIDGVGEVSLPVTIAVVTSIIAFIPLAFIAGIMGKFIAILPVVVITCLSVSLMESLFILPAHLSRLPELSPPGSKPTHTNIFSKVQKKVQAAFTSFTNNQYRNFLNLALTYRYIFLATAIATLIISIGLVSSGLIKFQVFPKIDGFVITATAEFPDGTPARVTGRALQKIERAIVKIAEETPTKSGEPLIKKRLVLLGQSLGERMGQSGSNIGSVQVILLESEKRGINSNDLLVAWEKEVGQIPGVKSLTFSGLSAGPGGTAIEIWLQGQELEQLLAAAGDLQDRLSTYDGVIQIRSDYEKGKNELKLKIKPEARSLAISAQDLASQVNAAFYGLEPLKIQREKEEVAVKVRYTGKERASIDSLYQMYIITPTGVRVPLRSVAEIEFAPGYSTITRTNGKRRVAVLADVDSKQANAQEIFADLNKNYFPQLREKYPGIAISLQGAKKDMRDSFSTLVIAFPLAMLIIYIIIASSFRSYVQPLVIMFTIPFGIIGAIWGHWLMGYDVSMMSMFGMVALAGVVVNDAIVFMDQSNKNLAAGMKLADSLRAAGQRRFLAITLTSLSTIGGLTPLLLETDLQARFLIPMAISMAAGVGTATILTLVLLPCLLLILNDLKRVIKRVISGKWPEREELEPAYQQQVK